MNGENSGKAGGLGFISALQLLFIGLKLARVIDGPWWAVMMPFLASFGLSIALILLLLAYYMVRNR